MRTWTLRWTPGFKGDVGVHVTPPVAPNQALNENIKVIELEPVLALLDDLIAVDASEDEREARRIAYHALTAECLASPAGYARPRDSDFNAGWNAAANYFREETKR